MNLPIPRRTLNITQNHIGGFSPMDVVYKIGLNDININTYHIQSIDNRLNNNSKFVFKFTSKNKKKAANNRYLGAGGLTAVYSIELISYDNNLPQDYKNKLEKYRDKYILRIFRGSSNLKIQRDVEIGEIDDSNDEQSKFINMWSNHKNLFPENIIDIFLYGDILINNEYLGYYSITRVYGDDETVKNLSFVDSMKYLKNLYIFLIKLKNLGLTYRDLKIENVGIDLENYNFIVIDYDDVTLLKPSDVKYLAENNFLHYSFGTYAPIYFLKNIQNNNFDMKFDLIYLYGLFNIVQYMFKLEYFKDDKHKMTINYIFNFLNKLDTIWEPIYKFVSCIYKNKTIPPKCEMFIKSIEIQYNYFIKNGFIDFFKKYAEILDKMNIAEISNMNDIEYIIIILMIYILYPLCVDNYEVASFYSQIENYNKIINIIDIILEKLNNNNDDDDYRKKYLKYLKYKMKYLKLKNSNIII